MKLMWLAAAVLLNAALAVGQEAYIREWTGTVEVKAPGAPSWTAARTGEGISRDTMVSTGFKSTALIAVGNSTVTVRPLTCLSLGDIQTLRGNETVNLSLRTGRIRADVKSPPGGRTEFTIRSPMATASVRGTSFEFDGVNLRVDEGMVHVTGGDGSAVYVGAGHEAASDPATGRTAGAAETARAELAPALPAGAAEAAPEPAAIIVIPETADTGFGFRWN
jgi:hypothetical protein